MKFFSVQQSFSDSDFTMLFEPVEVLGDSSKAWGETSLASIICDKTGDSNFSRLTVIFKHHHGTSWVTLYEIGS